MMRRVEVTRNFAGMTSTLAAKIKEHYDLEETPSLVYHESEGWIEVPNLPEIAKFVHDVDLRPKGSVDKGRALELLNKDELTDKEDKELNKLQRQWMKEQLGGLD